MSIIQDPTYLDDITNTYVSGSISISTSASQAKVGASRITNRKILRIYNNSNTTIYFGPTGVTSSNGEPLVKGQWVEVPTSGDIAVFLITASGTASDIRIQELA